MVLTEDLIDRHHATGVELLRLTSRGVALAFPDAATADIGTCFALYAGPGSPLTQVAGFAHRKPGDVDALDAFFTPLTDNWEVSITPFTDPGTARRLFEVGYRPAGFEGALAQRIERLPPEPAFDIVEVEDDLDDWMEATGRGWSGDESEGFVPDDLLRAVVGTPSRRYVAYVDGVPAASASTLEVGGIVALGGAATRVPFRGRGLQAALIARRLRDAGLGRLAFMGAVPGTSSYRNAQRAGFTPLFSSLTLTRR